MIKVDLILPSIISYQKYPKFQKFQGIQLFQRIPFPNWAGNWFPVWYNLKNLNKKGIKIRFLNYLNLKKELSKVIGIDSRIINNMIMKFGSVKKSLKEGVIPLLRELKKKAEYLIYFDNADSTGHFHSEVLPYVDRYFKKQILKDRSLYTKFLYRKRLFTDYYARNYNLIKNEERHTEFELVTKFQNKIDLSWNFAFKDYRYYHLLSRFLYGFTRKNNLLFHKPGINRKIILAANFTIKSSYKLVYYQRNQLLKLLKKKFNSNPNFSLGKISKKNYLKTMRSSMAIVSPYGWGEICYRDFETFIAGAALIKPDMEHLDTWPNLYKKNETYIPIPWKVEEWDDLFTKILADKKNLLEVAKKGQDTYKSIWTKKGNEAFCEHFMNMINR